MKKNKILIFVGLIFSIGVFQLWNNHKLNGILKKQQYTVGMIISKGHTRTTTKNWGKDYEYIIENKKYIRQTSSKVFLGKKYLIIYDSLHPKRSMLLNRYEINEQYDKKIWSFKEIPFKVDSTYIYNFVKGYK